MKSKKFVARLFYLGRSREGAWIEISVLFLPHDHTPKRRSREGAWIEIEKKLVNQEGVVGRSREGAWIEIEGP